MAEAEPLPSSGRLFAAAVAAAQRQQQPAPATTAAAAPAAAPGKAAASASAKDDGGDSNDPAVVAERLRRRGNAAFAAGKYLRAGELYRRALDALESASSASADPKTTTKAPPLPGAGKLHSNLAAVALQLGRPRAALASCAAAA